MSADPQLRVRIADDTNTRAKQILVVDAEGRVLGDLSASVGGVTYRMGVGGEMSVVQVELAVERVQIASIEVPGMNTPAAPCTHPVGKACARCSGPEANR
jgi:hypothetical protein